MKSYTEIIDQYLNNKLSDKEKQDFERALQTNEELRNQFRAQKTLIKGIRHLGLKNDIQQSVKKAKLAKAIKNISLGLVVAGLVAAGGYYVKTKLLDKTKNNIHYELNENGEKMWSDADKVLPSEFFEIDPSKDTTIETANGIVFQIPAGAYLNKFGDVPAGRVKLEIKEALNAFDIVNAGLSTTSNGRLLETGGMFYFNARSGNEVLSIDQHKPISVNVPYNGEKEMSLFDGERKKDGSINWVAPKKMRKQLNTVDIMKLNFYPPGFLDTLKRMGFNIKNKKVTDSIYYSFSNLNKCREDYSLYVTDDDEVRADTLKTTRNTVFSLSASSSVSMNNVDVKKRGEQLFRMNCATCHSPHTDQKITGPGLARIFDRAPKGDWLKRYILNNEKVIKSGDAYANKIYRENNKQAMNVFEGQLAGSDVDAILEYLRQAPGIQVPKSDSLSSCTSEINPSRIRSIWDSRFNKTILATKEFEKRLKVIFKTCNPALLDLYVKNLNSDLFQLDSIAVTITSGAEKEEFTKFYLRRDGGVPVSTEQTQKLSEYFESKRKVYDKAVSDAMEKFYSDERRKTNEIYQKKNEHANNEAYRSSAVLQEEIEKNIDEAYRQLGKTKPKISFPTSYVSGEIRTTGWKNVDVYVIEATINRATMNYTDPETGKKAIIEYKEASVVIADKNKYDRVVCYLLPKNLSSFQLMKPNGIGFAEKLNMTFKYGTLVIGYKGNKTYVYENTQLEPREYKIELKQIDSKVLKDKINAAHNISYTKDILSDIDFTRFDIEADARQAKIAQREELRRRIHNVIYPCEQLQIATRPVGYH